MSYFEYNGVKYAIGTKFRVKTAYNGVQIMTLAPGWQPGLQLENEHCYPIPIRTYTLHRIIDVVEPVYYESPGVSPPSNRNPPPDWDVEIGWVWYIIIMCVGSIFKDRWLLWICATIYFFLWKSGIFNGKNKKQ